MEGWNMFLLFFCLCLIIPTNIGDLNEVRSEENTFTAEPPEDYDYDIFNSFGFFSSSYDDTPDENGTSNSNSTYDYDDESEVIPATSTSPTTTETTTTTMRPTTTETTTMPTTPKPIVPICPCAWLERGGFWSDRRYFTQTRRRVSFVAGRCGCRAEDKLQCIPGWTEDQQTLIFKWIGMPDSRKYDFQMKFCFNVMPYWRRYCTHKEVVYRFLQHGTWLYLLNVNCRCPYRVADVKSFVYGSPTSPSARHFRPRYIDMQCTRLHYCDIKEACYSEPISADGKLRGGVVRCICPEDHFCPLYYIGGRRRAVKAFNGNGTTEYQVFCAKS